MNRTPITNDDVDEAPPEKRAVLEKARDRGELVCGRVTAHNLAAEQENPDFAPAVPFVTGLSGLIGAAETMKRLLGQRYDLTLHCQHNSQSERMRALLMECEPGCECRTRNSPIQD